MIENEQLMKEVQERARRRQEALRVENIDWVERRRETVRGLLFPINILTDRLAEIKQKNLERGKWKLTNEDDELKMMLQGIVNAEHLTVGEYHCWDDYRTKATIEIRRKPTVVETDHHDPLRYQEHFMVGNSIAGYEAHMRGDIVEYRRGVHEVVLAQDEPQLYARITRPFVGDNILRERAQAAQVVPVSNEEAEKWFANQDRLHERLAQLLRKRKLPPRSPQS